VIIGPKNVIVIKTPQLQQGNGTEGVVTMAIFPNIRQIAAMLGLVVSGLLLWQSPVLAQETTGTVTGVVKDASGAVMPRAAVVLTDLDNKSERTTTSNGLGIFTIASVPSGLQYQVTVSSKGFTNWESQTFPLRPGDQVNFTDISLKVGAVTDQVTVEQTASQAVKPLDTPERSDVITAKDLDTLAIQGRDATELIEMLPGFALVSPGLNNQSPNDAVVGVSSAATGSYSSNGTGTTGIATILDGVSLTDIDSNAGTTQTVNNEMVSEIKVFTSSFSAEFAHGPTVINAVTKSGTTSYHGSAYLYARNAALDANDWYNNTLGQTRPDGRYFFPGGTVGGPLWIPHTRLHRDNSKLFFFAGYEYYNQLYSPETLGSWVPTMAQRSGDFSVASLNAQLCGARPDGGANLNAIQPMCNGENFLPDGTSIKNGNLAGQGNASGIALLNWLPLPNADPFTNITGYNYIQKVLQQQNGSMFHSRLDYSLSDSNKLYATYGRQSQVTQDPVAYGYAPQASVLFPGQVTSGDISNIVSLTYTHVFGTSVTNELNVALSLISDPANEGNPAAVGRFTMNAYNCNDPAKRAAGTCGSSGNGNFNELGEFKNAGDYSVPALSDYSNLGYPNVAMPGGFYNDQVHMKKEVPDAQDAVSWFHGAHTVTLGGYYEKGILNGLANYSAYPQGQYTFNPSVYQYDTFVGQNSQFTNCENPNPAGNGRLSGAAYLGNCINPNALMYLGYADTYTQTNFSPIVDMQYQTLAGFVNDSWRVHRVTLQLGTRIEHLGPWVDRHGNGLATFSPSLYNTQCAARICGSQNDPGITWHGINAGVRNSISKPTPVFVSPRLGLAWDLFGHGNTVLRGGWGVYRHEEEFMPYALAGATAQGYKTTFQQATATTALSFDAIDSRSPINPSDFSVYTLSPDDSTRPIYYEYNGAISQRLNTRSARWQSLVEVAYVGNNSQHLSTYNNQASGYNGVSDLNLIPAGFFLNNATGAGFLGRLGADPAAPAGGTPDSLASMSTPQTDYFRTYPFYQHIYALQHNYYANYNSLQVTWNKSNGPIQFGANYTFSKNLATAASYNNVVPDPLNLRNEYNPVPFDRTQVLNVHYLIDFGTRYHGDHHLFAEALNGWQISGISSLQSGPPLASLQGGNFGFGYGLIQPVQVYIPQQASANAPPNCQKIYGIPDDRNGNTICVTNVSPNVWLGSPDYQLMPTVLCNPTSGLKKNQFINPTCFGIPAPGGASAGIYGGLATNPTGQGQYRLPYIHGPAYAKHDLTLLKNFSMGEKRNLQFRLAAFNFLNHPLTSFNNNDQSNLTLAFQGATVGKALTTSDLTHQGFGIANVKYGARNLELSVKFQF
jgi:Carboxypeptidase regulatory-like domain/TonB-dependent Receptor Plug Domain